MKEESHMNTQAMKNMNKDNVDFITPATNAIETIINENKIENNKTLKEYVHFVMKNYFANVGNQVPNNIYEMVLAQIEPPLLQAVLDFTRGNQSKAAILLGLSRGTLRKKLKCYGLIK